MGGSLSATAGGCGGSPSSPPVSKVDGKAVTSSPSPEESDVLPKRSSVKGSCCAMRGSCRTGARERPAGSRPGRRRDCVKGRGEWIGSERTSEPERADEMLMPGVAGQHFAIKALARLLQRRIMAVLFCDPRSRSPHDDTPRGVNVNAEAGIGRVHGRTPSRSSCDRLWQMTQLHGELGGYFVVREVVEQFQNGAATTAIDQNGPLAVHGRRPALACITAIIVMRARPDVLKSLFAGHGAHRPGLAVDDGGLHAIGRAAIGKVAIAVKPPDAAIDWEREEDAGDAAGHVFAEREHIAAHEQRRQDIEHILVVALGDLEPLASEQIASIAVGHGGCAAMTVEHMVHLAARRDAFENLADCG